MLKFPTIPWAQVFWGKRCPLNYIGQFTQQAGWLCSTHVWLSAFKSHLLFLCNESPLHCNFLYKPVFKKHSFSRDTRDKWMEEISLYVQKKCHTSKIRLSAHACFAHLDSRHSHRKRLFLCKHVIFSKSEYLQPFPPPTSCNNNNINLRLKTAVLFHSETTINHRYWGIFIATTKADHSYESRRSVL